MILRLLAALTLVSQAPSAPFTLRDELTKHVSVLPKAEDLARPITSYAVLDTPSWFAIGYYQDQGDGRLPQKLRVRTYDRRGKRWRSAVLKGHFGSVTEVRRHHGLFYLTGSLTPSAASTQVLSNELRRVRSVDGWPRLALPDGRMVLENSTVHFAPVHPAALSVYDPGNDSVRRLYPAKDHEPHSSTLPDGTPVVVLVDRSIASVSLEPGGAIAFVVSEWSVTLDRDQTPSPGPARNVAVTCDMSGARPRCTTK